MLQEKVVQLQQMVQQLSQQAQQLQETNNEANAQLSKTKKKGKETVARVEGELEAASELQSTDTGRGSGSKSK